MKNWFEMETVERQRWMAVWHYATKARTVADLTYVLRLLERVTRP